MQAICQVDKYSFIIITNLVEDRTKGFTNKQLGELMEDMNCDVAVRTDGGGSTSFHYKKDSPEITTVKTYHSGRQFADVLYRYDAGMVCIRRQGCLC